MTAQATEFGLGPWIRFVCRYNGVCETHAPSPRPLCRCEPLYQSMSASASGWTSVTPCTLLASSTLKENSTCIYSHSENNSVSCLDRKQEVCVLCKHCVPFIIVGAGMADRPLHLHNKNKHVKLKIYEQSHARPVLLLVTKTNQIYFINWNKTEIK